MARPQDTADPCHAFSYGMGTGPVVAPLLDGGLSSARLFDGVVVTKTEGPAFEVPAL